MALSEEVILQQINVLTTKTVENAEMIYKSIPALNKGLNPEYFSGNETKIVNAINKLAAEVNVLNEAVVNMITRMNGILSDTGGTDNKERWEETKELMGADNIVDGIRAILEGNRQEQILGLHIADNGKLLSVTINNEGTPEVKPISIDSLTVEVGSYDVSYINRDYKGINSVGEAIDIILENIPKLADDLVIEDNSLVLKAANNTNLANVPITNDGDIDNIINSLDM